MRHNYKPRSIRKFEHKTRRKIIFTIIISIVLLYLTFTIAIPFLIGSLKVFQKKPTVAAQQYDDKLAPPILNIPFDATNSASLDIDGYAATDTQVELYINDTPIQKTFTDSTGSFRFSLVSLQIGRNFIYGKTISDDKSSLPSKGIKLDYSNEKPNLEVYEPTDNIARTGGDRRVKIDGKTDDTDTTVTINGKQVYVSADGKFTDFIDLTDGDNQITVISINKYGNATQITRKAIFTP
jgi:hypothetical protein